MKKPNLKEISKPKKMKNRDLYNLYFNLKHLLENRKLKGLYVLNCVTTTVEDLQPIINRLSPENCIPYTEKYEEFRKTMFEFYKEVSEGKKKKITLPNGTEAEVWDFDENDISIQERKQALIDQYQEEIDLREEDEKQWNEFMDEDFEGNPPLKKINIEKLSDDAVSDQDDYFLLHPLLK